MELHPYLFCLFFCLLYFSYLLLKTIGCSSGCLMSSACIQKLFCGIYLAFECSFDEFVGEKVVSPSYSSGILGPPPGTPHNSNVGAFDIIPKVSETILSSFHSFYFILLFRSYFHHFMFQLTDLFFCFRYSIDSFQSIFNFNNCVVCLMFIL